MTVLIANVPGISPDYTSFLKKEVMPDWAVPYIKAEANPGLMRHMDSTSCPHCDAVKLKL